MSVFGCPTRVLAKASKSLTLGMVARKLGLPIWHHAAANDLGIYFTGRVASFPLGLRLTFTIRNLSLVFYAPDYPATFRMHRLHNFNAPYHLILHWKEAPLEIILTMSARSNPGIVGQVVSEHSEANFSNDESTIRLHERL